MKQSKKERSRRFFFVHFKIIIYICSFTRPTLKRCRVLVLCILNNKTTMTKRHHIVLLTALVALALIFPLRTSAQSVVNLVNGDSIVLDACELGVDRAVLSVGHYNLSEAGMEYMLTWLPDLIGKDIPMTFVPAADRFGYLIKEE